MTAVEVRRATDDDRTGVLDLMRLSLGWQPGDGSDALFRWKHDDGAFGPSPAWVATDRDQVVGFRTFMRWEFDDHGECVRAVRAVDTATHPRHQGRGIFRTLTLAALEQLRAEGVQLVFNTPNDQSRPGYLKMGWEPVGVLPVLMRPQSVAALGRVARARAPADLWSQDVPDGRPAAAVLDHQDLGACLKNAASAPGLVTRRTVPYMRWRYGLPQLRYHVHIGRGGVRGGFAVYRVRRRGGARECAVTELVTPDDKPAARAALLRGALRDSGADYAVALQQGAVRPPGLLRLPRQGPLLVARRLARSSVPDVRRWQLALGDVELF